VVYVEAKKPLPDTYTVCPPCTEVALSVNCPGDIARVAALKVSTPPSDAVAVNVPRGRVYVGTVIEKLPDATVALPVNTAMLLALFNDTDAVVAPRLRLVPVTVTKELFALAVADAAVVPLISNVAEFANVGSAGTSSPPTTNIRVTKVAMSFLWILIFPPLW